MHFSKLTPNTHTHMQLQPLLMAHYARGQSMLTPSGQYAHNIQYRMDTAINYEQIPHSNPEWINLQS